MTLKTKVAEKGEKVPIGNVMVLKLHIFFQKVVRACLAKFLESSFCFSKLKSASLNF